MHFVTWRNVVIIGTYAIVLALSLSFIGCATPTTARFQPVYDETTRTIRMDADTVNDECWARGARAFSIAACYVVQDDIIILPFPHSVGLVHYNYLRDHEECHRLGWRADHVGARPKGCK